MAQQGLAHRIRPTPYHLLPFAAGHRAFYFRHHSVEHQIKQIVLSRYVVVKRHRGHTQRSGQFTHRQGVKALLIGKL